MCTTITATVNIVPTYWVLWLLSGYRHLPQLPTPTGLPSGGGYVTSWSLAGMAVTIYCFLMSSLMFLYLIYSQYTERNF
ncbi:hypothetical protein L208DRAFT_144257 [Tricholoma matsutake]|nr:hypothetical protein L208DRAFT_144257 [Tricholoma matsutake 945]